MGHILERFAIHFIGSTFLVIVYYYALEYSLHKVKDMYLWVSTRPRHILTLSALLVANSMILREPFDIFFGNNTIIKSVFDTFSWYAGCAFSAWGIYRFIIKRRADSEF